MQVAQTCGHDFRCRCAFVEATRIEETGSHILVHRASMFAPHYRVTLAPFFFDRLMKTPGQTSRRSNRVFPFCSLPSKE